MRKWNCRDGTEFEDFALAPVDDLGRPLGWAGGDDGIDMACRCVVLVRGLDERLA